MIEALSLFKAYCWRIYTTETATLEKATTAFRDMQVLKQFANTIPLLNQTIGLA